MSEAHTEIKPLNQWPEEFCETLAGWSYREWNEKRQVPYRAVLNDFRNRRKSFLLPATLVCVRNRIPAGMVTLKENDLNSRKDITPWLSSLYVAPEMRRKGIGGSLVSEASALAGALAFQKLYLFLAQDDRAGLEVFYSKRGWRLLGPAVDNDGNTTKVFCFELN